MIMLGAQLTLCVVVLMLRVWLLYNKNRWIGVLICLWLCGASVLVIYSTLGHLGVSVSETHPRVLSFLLILWHSCVHRNGWALLSYVRASRDMVDVQGLKARSTVQRRSH